MSESNDFDDTELMPFWSDRAYATACAKNEWSDYKPEIIPIVDFIESWCIGMHNNDILVATNMDSNMFGKEVEPLELTLEILAVIIAEGKQLNWLKYESAEVLELRIKEMLNK